MSDTGWHHPDQPNDPSQQQHQPNMPPPPSWQAPHQPGVIPLRPLGLTEIIDAAVKTMRAYPAVMLGVAAIVVTIVSLATVPFQLTINESTADLEQASNPDELADSLGSMAVSGGIANILGLIASAVLAGILTTVVGKAVLGRPAPLAQVWAEVKPQLLKLLGLAVLTIMPVLGLGLVVGIVLAAAPPLIAIAGPAAAVFAIWIYISYFWLAAPALVLERIGVIEALKRSRALVRNSWWRVFGYWLLGSFLVFVITAVIQIPFGIIGGGASAFSGDPGELTFFAIVVTTIGAIIAGAITEPFLAAVTALLYTDQRMRREGLDIELARNAGTQPPQQ